MILFSVRAGGPMYKNYRLEQKTLTELREVERNLAQNPEEVIKRLDGLIKYAIQEDLQESLSFSYYLMGSAYKELRQPQLALHFMALAKENYDKPVTTSKNIKGEELKGPKEAKNRKATLPNKYYLEMGEIYMQLGEYIKANEWLTTYKNKVNDPVLEGEVNYLIAQNWYALENYTEAIVLYQQLLEEEIQAQNEIQMRVCYSRLAACYISLDDTEQGLLYYNKSIHGVNELQQQDAKSFSDYNTISKNKEVVTNALRKQNKLAEEAEIRSEALNIIDDSMEYLRLAQVYLKAGNLEDSENSLDQYFDNISYNLIDAKEIEVIKEMALNLKNRNNHQKALQYLLMYENLSDTIRNRLLALERTSNRLGATGYQNSLQLEILRKNKEISDNTINLLMRQSALKEENLKSQKTIIFLLAAFILIVMGALAYIIKVSQQRRIANQQLALRSLRTQMNPHFIFNALNSVNSFISVSDEHAANKFLTEFSTLMRIVMENSEHDFIPLTKEIEILKIYLELEHFRFKDKFDYKLHIDHSVDMDDLVIPPMMIQPYIENAIWHGLRYKDSSGNLDVQLSYQENTLKVEVKDDGIGRLKSKEIKTKNQRKTSSTALKNIQERVHLFNHLHQLQVDVEITDLHENGSGTVVTILIPQPVV